MTITYNKPAIVKLDMNTVQFFETYRTQFFNDFFQLFTYFGSIKFLLPLCLMISIFLFIRKRYIEILFLFITLFGVRWLNELLKEVFKRDRPALHPLVSEKGYSFPSGHVMNSIAVYAFIFFLILYVLHVEIKRKVLIILIPIFIISLVVISRMYLGVHNLTDVVAGLSIGWIYMMCIQSLYRFITELAFTRRKSQSN